jgi:hypothetical protein
MFCNQCGAPLQPDYNLCPKCGQPLGRITPRDPGRLERHLRILAMLWVIVGALFLIPSVILVLLGGAAHFVIHGEPVAEVLGPLVLYLIGGSLLLVGAGGVCVGWGLMQRQPWARIAALVLGILALFHPPFGTALGIYTLWVLLANDASAQYERMARAA